MLPQLDVEKVLVFISIREESPGVAVMVGPRTTATVVALAITVHMETMTSIEEAMMVALQMDTLGGKVIIVLVEEKEVMVQAVGLMAASDALATHAGSMTSTRIASLKTVMRISSHTILIKAMTMATAKTAGMAINRTDCKMVATSMATRDGTQMRTVTMPQAIGRFDRCPTSSTTR
jgi:hypothetical protein